MSLSSVHPQYAESFPDWKTVRDVYKGQRHVKDQGKLYLPPTSGMILDGYGKVTSGGPTIGQAAYDSYLLRAVLPEYVSSAVEVFIGLLHSQPPNIELPAVMEPLRERITMYGESMEQLLRRINEEQLVTGRVGLLLDLPASPDPASPLPYIALYVAEACRNWDDNDIDEGEARLNLVVLDETGYSRDQFKWELTAKYRVLELAPLENSEDGTRQFGEYRQGVFTSKGGGEPDYVESDMKPPMLRGQTLEEIPFVFINTSDIVATPGKAPLLTLAEACLTIYRGEADYRQNLFLQGQDTLVVKGEIKRSADPNELAAAKDDEPLRTGTGSMIHLEAGADNDAKYIGVGSSGLAEQRTALENDRKRAEAKSGALSSDNAQTQESGEALKTRVAARTASLNQIARTGAGGLEALLKIAARWMGADPDQVKVTPNLEFADYQMTGENLARLMAAKQAGAPLSNQSIHELMAEGGLTKLTYEDEQDLLEKEREEQVPPGTDAGGDPIEQPAPPAQA